MVKKCSDITKAQYAWLFRNAKDRKDPLFMRDVRAVSTGTNEHFYKGLERRLVACLSETATGTSEFAEHKKYGDNFWTIMGYIKNLQEMGGEDPERIKRLKLAVMGTLLDVIGYNSWYYVPISDGKLFDTAESGYRERQIKKIAAEPFYDA